MYFIFTLFCKIINVFPLKCVLNLGKLIGLGFYYFSRSKRKVGFINLKLAFPHKDNREILYILKKSLMNFGMSIIESLVIKKLIDKKFIEDLDFDDAEENNILVGVHGGSWELYNAKIACYRKFAVLVQKQKNVCFDRFINEQRNKNNINICFSLKCLIEYLNKGYWIGLVVDHGAEKKSLYIEFFGSEVPTPGGAVHIAKKFNKRIYPVFGRREKDGRHVLKIGESIDCRAISNKEALLRLNRTYEKFISLYPSEYMWWYKRFKRRKTFYSLILSDGKIGHLKQSLFFQAFLENKGYKIKKEIVEITGLTKTKRAFIEACAFFSHKSVGKLYPLKWVLKNEEFYKLSRVFADFVISTGSSLGGINLIVAHSLGAKSIVILKPNLPIEKFDLAVIPEHDNLQAENVVNIKGALSYPLDSYNDGLNLSRHFSLSSKDKIAVFIGGPLTNGNIFYENIKIFIDKLKNFSLRKDFKILISTSRRTPSAIEKLIEEELKEFRNTEVIIIANRKNYPFVTGGFLHFASFVFITADSISMISESLSMKKTTICIELEEILNIHHVNFMDSVRDLINFIKSPYENMDNFYEPSFSLLEYNQEVLKKAIQKII